MKDAVYNIQVYLEQKKNADESILSLIGYHFQI